MHVYRLMAAGTMEEKIYNRQVNKQGLAARVVDEHQVGPCDPQVGCRVHTRNVGSGTLAKPVGVRRHFHSPYVLRPFRHIVLRAEHPRRSHGRASSCSWG